MKQNQPIIVPDDRSLREPVIGFCRNADCREPLLPGLPPTEFRFRIEHDRCACPKCGAERGPMVGPVVLTHLLLPDPKGPVLGRTRNFRIACEQNRAYMATVTNLEAATDRVQLCNCKGCLDRALALRVPGTETNPLTQASHGKKS